MVDRVSSLSADILGRIRDLHAMALPRLGRLRITKNQPYADFFPSEAASPAAAATMSSPGLVGKLSAYNSTGIPAVTCSGSTGLPMSAADLLCDEGGLSDDEVDHSSIGAGPLDLSNVSSADGFDLESHHHFYGHHALQEPARALQRQGSFGATSGLLRNVRDMLGAAFLGKPSSASLSCDFSFGHSQHSLADLVTTPSGGFTNPHESSSAWGSLGRGSPSVMSSPEPPGSWGKDKRETHPVDTPTAAAPVKKRRALFG